MVPLLWSMLPLCTPDNGTSAPENATCLHLLWSYLLFSNQTYVFRCSAHDNSSTRLYFPLVNKLRQFSFWPLTARNLHLAHFYVVTFFTYFSFILGSLVFNLQIICMTTISVATLLSELDHWISCLTAVKSSLETQVSLLDSGLSNLHSSQPSSPAIHNIQSVHLALTYQLSEVVRELSDLDLTRNLLATNIPSNGNSYEYLFRLSDRRNSLRHRASYYQGLSTLFDEIYTYLYQN